MEFSLAEKLNELCRGSRLPYVLLAFVLYGVVYASKGISKRKQRLPIINPPGFFSARNAREVHLADSRSLLREGREKWPNRPFRMVTDYGETVILPGEYANEIRNQPGLSFGGATRQDNFGNFTGFKTYAELGRHDDLFQTVAKKHLTKLVAKVTEPLSQEASLASSLAFGENVEEWRDVAIGPAVLDIVSRMSSRVFLGEELCRDEAWLKITKEYAIAMFAAIRKFAHYPAPMRGLMQWFIPECKTVRELFQTASDIIAPALATRQRIKKEAQMAGKEAPVFHDALEWVANEARILGVSYDMTTFQLMLSVVAIHTSTDLLVQIMLDIAQHPESVKPLREEVIKVLGEGGWRKTTLYHLKLMDSAFKESQRLRPVGTALMRRSVDRDFTLSDGTFLQKGMRVQVDAYRMTSPLVYDDPDTWNPSRFLDLRSMPGHENTAQLVSTTQDHLGFGFGDHSCPGRFFAANELKIALCHLLVKYEWKLTPGTDVKPYMKGFALQKSPTARIMIRRRGIMEIDIDDLETEI